MIFFKRKSKTPKSPALLVDAEESDGVFNVYHVQDYPDMTIFINVPKNLATLTVELEPDTEERDGTYLSSERMEDWAELEKRYPYWAKTLRTIELMYRNEMERLTMEGEEE